MRELELHIANTSRPLKDLHLRSFLVRYSVLMLILYAKLRILPKTLPVLLTCIFILITSSWGKQFGDQGYIRMARNKNDQCGIALYGCYPVI